MAQLRIDAAYYTQAEMEQLFTTKAAVQIYPTFASTTTGAYMLDRGFWYCALEGVQQRCVDIAGFERICVDGKWEVA